MSVALKAVAWAWRFTQTEKRLPGVQSTGESFYRLYDKNFVLILICELGIYLKFSQILENYVTYNL